MAISKVQSESESRKPLTQERLKEVMAYDPHTGRFTWLYGKFFGQEAGYIQPSGYRKIMVDHGRYYAHRLAWFYVNGVWPVEHIDHINGIRADNRIANLREATLQQNNLNSRRRSDNKSGTRGVFFARAPQRWIAQVECNGRVFRKTFRTKEQAVAARLQAVREMHGTFARVE